MYNIINTFFHSRLKVCLDSISKMKWNKKTKPSFQFTWSGSLFLQKFLHNYISNSQDLPDLFIVNTCNYSMSLFTLKSTLKETTWYQTVRNHVTSCLSSDMTALKSSFISHVYLKSCFIAVNPPFPSNWKYWASWGQKGPKFIPEMQMWILPNF